jgi:hypothetical protein
VETIIQAVSPVSILAAPSAAAAVIGRNRLTNSVIAAKTLDIFVLLRFLFY